jgi:hypothetical protein
MGRFLVPAAAIVAVLAGAVAAEAQSQANRTVEQYSCKDVMRESGVDRDVAIAFLQGYLLGRSNESGFNVDVMEKQTDAFIDRCLDNPNEKAVEAMRNVKK